MNYLKVAIISGAALVMTGCFDNKEAVVEHNRCTSVWYEQVESEYPTGDGQGHGPDLGSEEWRSVVEFKLGIRDDDNVPATSSEEWCTYIDERYIQAKANSQ